LVRIAEIACGPEYSGIQKEIENAAGIVGSKIFIPEVEASDIKAVEDEMGFHAASPGLRVMMARAKAIAEGRVDADGIFIATCFRCAEGALVRSVIRHYLQTKTKIPVVTYSFTERTKAGALLLRMEALVDIMSKKPLFARNKQEGITAGIDSGSTTTKAVIMKDNQIIGTGWAPSTGIVESGVEVFNQALKEAGIPESAVEAIGVTGYGRKLLKEKYKAPLAMEEVSTCSKGALFLTDKQKGDATVIDIGGQDNKAVTLYDSIPDSFTVGGICAGASGRFLETTAKRLGVSMEEFGEMGMRGDYTKVPMNAYCIVFGLQDLVAGLASGASKEDAAAAACHSVAEQVFEQQLQEIDIRYPIIEVGSTALIKGLVKGMSQVLSVDMLVPPKPNLIGCVGAAVMVSGMKELEEMG